MENRTAPSTLLRSGRAAKALTGKRPKGFGSVAGTGDAAVPGCSGSRPAVFIPLYPTFLLPDAQSPGATAASEPLLIAGARFPYDGAFPSFPFGVSLSIVSVRETWLFWFIALASYHSGNLTLAGLAATVT